MIFTTGLPSSPRSSSALETSPSPTSTPPTSNPCHPTEYRLFSSLRRRYSPLILLISLFLLSACVHNEEQGNPDGWQEILPAPIPELQALLPEDIADRGHLTAASNTPFAPNEFRDSQGNIIGFEVDLIKAAASLLGLTVDIRQQDFNLILPSVNGGAIDVGVSGFTDTEERRKSFDFVDYFSAGIAWATAPGSTMNTDNICGMTIAVQKGTYSDTNELQKHIDHCSETGQAPIQKQVYSTSDAAATAVILGKADALSADSQVISYAVQRSENKLITQGEPYDTAPFGWAIKKNSELSTALGAALQYLIDSGDYQKILKPWGLEEGGIPAAMINGHTIEKE